MKKLLALFLVFSMLLAMLTVPTMAEEPAVQPIASDPIEEIPGTDASNSGLETVTRNDTTYEVYDDPEDEYDGYLVVRTIDQFLKMDDEDGEAKFILANDIDFGGKLQGSVGHWGNGDRAVVGGVAEAPAQDETIYAGTTVVYRLHDFTFEGNGYVLNNYKPTNETAGGLFTVTKGATTIIRNLGINVTGDVSLTNNSAGVLIGTTISDSTNDTKVTISNVDIYVPNISATKNNGVFVAKQRCSITYENCTLQGTFSFNENSGEGGFVGLLDQPCTATFTDCTVNGTYTGKARTGAFVGYVANAGVVNFTRCATSGTYSLTGWTEAVYNKEDPPKQIGTNYWGSGAFVGNLEGSSKASFNACTASGTYTAQGVAGVFVGNVNTAAADAVSFTSCTAEGTYTIGTVAGIYVGRGSSATTISFDGCKLLNVDATFSGGKCGGFVGYAANGNYSFTNECSATGNYKMTAGQIAVYVGQFEGNAKTLSFTNCSADVNVLSTGDTAGIYLGMSYNNNTINLTSCTSNGTYIDYANHGSRSWANSFIACVGAGKAVTVNFDDCTTNMILMGWKNVSGFIASTKDGKSGDTVQVTFNNCTNNATMLSGSTASAWFVEPIGKTVVENEVSVQKNPVITFTGTNKDNSTMIAATNVSYSNANIQDNANVNTYNATNGELAYVLATAQKNAGINSNYYFGQQLKTDALPKISAAAVDCYTSKGGEKTYINGVVKTVDCTEAPKAFLQIAPEVDGKRDARFVVAVSDAKLAEVKDVTITITFTTTDAGEKTYTVAKKDIDTFEAVWAGGDIKVAEDGYVLLAVTIVNIPVDAWDGNDETPKVALTMAAFDAEGTAIEEYTIA